jgi:signal transduction histidine kinase/CheY-like chemotaxis protein
MVLGKKNKTIASLKSELDKRDAELEKLRASHSGPGEIPPIQSAVLEMNETGYWIRNRDGSGFWISPLARTIMGLSASADWDNLRNAILPDDRPAFERCINELKPESKPQELELKIARSEAEGREYRLVGMVVKMLAGNQSGPGQDVVVGSVKDISRQDKIKRDLVKAREKVEDTGRLKNILLSNISHDIRTPMNAIIGFSELLSMGNLPLEKRNKYVQTIKNQGVQILKVIDDLVELTRFESGNITIRKSPCNLDLLLNELATIFNTYKKSQNKELEIRLGYSSGQGTVIYTDTGRLQELISNLVQNAIKFTEKGWIEIGYKVTSDRKIEFFVRDTGIGLSKEMQRNIFQPLAEEDAAGTKPGLGLVICRNIVKLLGGKIWVESEPGQGSTFYFTIPFEEVPETYHNLTPDEEQQLLSYKWKDKVILVAEDDAVNFRFLEALLQDTGVQILHARNGLQAVELCLTINKIDLVLMDIKMPELNGIEATRKIRSFNKRIPIIAQTAFSMDYEIVQCLEAGCNDHITKPIDIREFMEKVDGYLRETS